MSHEQISLTRVCLKLKFSEKAKKFDEISISVTSKPKSLYRRPRHFYETENEIWAGFGPVGNTEKKLGADYEQLLRVFFSCFQGQKNNF